MLRNVKIIEKESAIVISEYPIILSNPNVSEKDYFDAAWKRAIEDGLVDPDIKSDYKIEMVDEISK